MYMDCSQINSGSTHGVLVGDIAVVTVDFEVGAARVELGVQD